MSDVARLLSLSEREVYSLAQTGRLGAVRLGRAVRIPLDALERFIEDKEVQSRERSRNYGS